MYYSVFETRVQIGALTNRGWMITGTTQDDSIERIDESSKLS